MENPATWGEAEKIIDRTLTAGNRAALRGEVGWSLAKQIAEALREACLLRDEDEAAHLFYSNPEHLRVTGPGQKRKGKQD